MDLFRRTFVTTRKGSYGMIMVFGFLIGITAIESLLQDHYVGCFYESDGNSAQPVVANDNALTIEKCIDQCHILNNTYVGLQNGTSCLCLDDYGLELQDTSCSLTCSGNPSQYCGGTIFQSLAYVVYTVCPIGNHGPLCNNSCHCKRQAACNRMTGRCPDGCHGNWSGPTCDTKNISGQYIGCYRDHIDNRSLNIDILATTKSNNTIELCIESCAFYNASYAGLQWSVECFCGETYDRYGRLNESTCSWSCSGDEKEVCGAGNANSVYSICPVGNYGNWCLGGCNCLDNKRCVYENGSCPSNLCQSGWTGDSCDSRDCAVNNGDCYANETCSNINLQYAHLSMCQCSTGFQRNKTWENCTDIDECSRRPSACNSESEICINTIGSYICNKAGTSNSCLSSVENCLNGAGIYRCDSKPGGSTTCMCENSGLYSVGAMIGVGLGCAAGSALIVCLICIGINLCRRGQRTRRGTKSTENIDSQSQVATGAQTENPFPPTERYEALNEREDGHRYSTLN